MSNKRIEAVAAGAPSSKKKYKIYKLEDCLGYNHSVVQEAICYSILTPVEKRDTLIWRVFLNTLGNNLKISEIKLIALISSKRELESADDIKAINFNIMYDEKWRTYNREFIDKLRLEVISAYRIKYEVLSS